MKELKYVKTFEQFNYNEEDINEGIIGDTLKKGVDKVKKVAKEISSTKESIKAVLKEHSDNLTELVKKIKSIFSLSLNKVIDKKIGELDTSGAKSILQSAVKFYEKDPNNKLKLMWDKRTNELKVYPKNVTSAKNVMGNG